MIRDFFNKIYAKLFSENKQSKAIEGVFIRGNNVRIENSNIKVGKKAKLIIGDHVSIIGYTIIIDEGEFTIGTNTHLSKGSNPNSPSLYIYDGKLSIANNCTIKSDFVIRFGGKCIIGAYNCINEQTEIRCDEQIVVGDFNMISYECMIYDTNTHCMYEPIKRREITKKDFPFIGIEYEKPKTNPIFIGNDCWLGKRSVVLKGCNIGNESVIAACSVVTGNVPEKNIAYGNPFQVKIKKS
jgi:acetyltransferase-like isoleucine patch superfamily enzyme